MSFSIQLKISVIVARLLCQRSGMNLANLSTRMEMQSAEVKYCKLTVLQAFFKRLGERQASQNEPKKGRCYQSVTDVIFVPCD